MKKITSNQNKGNYQNPCTGFYCITFKGVFDDKNQLYTQHKGENVTSRFIGLQPRLLRITATTLYKAHQH